LWRQDRPIGRIRLGKRQKPEARQVGTPAKLNRPGGRLRRPHIGQLNQCVNSWG